ncbi:MAG: right-handed parallel beta-helix repeat-containing protein [Spirochaetales bacterium]|nr:right-handed parallel beta-helix repeat-containing protein [Spirochaetales bacterium]
MKKKRVMVFIFLILLIFSCPPDPELPPDQSEPQGKGATLPWTTYEAERGSYSGSLLTWSVAKNDGVGDPAGEASGRSAVRLASTGDYVEWAMVKACNALVVRYSIPDAPGGYGQNCSLSIYKNGEKMNTIELTSRYSWLYGNEAHPSEDPSAGVPRHIYDESQKVLSFTYEVGDILRLQKDSSDNAAYYDIDFIEMEIVEPIAQPSGSTSVVDYGADPTGVNDSTDAIKAAISASGGIVWFPPGVYRQYAKISVQGITLQGAGYWFTTIWGADSWNDNSEKTGFLITGGNTTIRDMMIRGESHIRDTGNSGIVIATGNYNRIINVWVEHTNTGIWSGWDNTPTADNLLIEGCRVRNTSADGIDLLFASQNCLINQTTTRCTGDDGIVIWSRKTGSSGPAKNNTISNCTIQLNWRANGMTLCGGENTTVKNILIKDTLTHPGLYITTSFWPYPFGGTTNISDVDLIRCGGAFWSGEEFGALRFCAENSDITAPINLSNISIINPVYSGIMFSSRRQTNEDFSLYLPETWHSFPSGYISLSNVTVSNASTYGISVDEYGYGGANFTNVTISATIAKVKNDSEPDFVLNRISGNDW